MRENIKLGSTEELQEWWHEVHGTTTEFTVNEPDYDAEITLSGPSA